MQLSVQHLVRHFGVIRALDDVSFDVAAGEVVGLIGPNGAGKSTLLDCVAGLHAVDSGTVALDGLILDARARRKKLVYMPDGIAPWPDQPAGRVLDFATRAFGGDEGWRTSVGAALDIGGFVGQRVGELSKGQ